VIAAIREKGRVLGESEEIAALDEIIGRYDESVDDYYYRHEMANIFYEKGMALSEQGRFEEALDVFEEYEHRFDDMINSNHRQQLAEAKENAAKGESCGSRIRRGIVTYE
jgi:tetratricopeptide (TPR) repeat protein